ncbi:hypothetical protein F994_02038 [Acinetobacter bohemicus ANC 3994]|uniref:Uncharacterized protein n=1 Tax=Acinetobacter bohemicus ANC 3994 TaxID=1217715 RepID=N8QB87_9GAMM|nr:hypothetical protein [Acinetobacter bohemicus]ENU19182.1 hypothetical protein F994_02038 [Acinetobacter bohemicus ANC 3994]
MSHFNFEESISIGIERADIAEANKNEITEIFNDFSQAFQKASNNKIHATIKSKQRKIYEGNNALLAAASRFNFKYESFNALVLSNGSKDYTIAEIIENEDGYPLRIKVEDYTSSYSDKDSLVVGLSKLVARTEVGKYFKLLLNDE